MPTLPWALTTRAKVTIGVVIGVVAGFGGAMVIAAVEQGAADELSTPESMLRDAATDLLAHDVVVPATDPPSLDSIFAMDATHDGVAGFETAYQHGALQVLVCDFPVDAHNSCTQGEPWQVFREEQHAGRVVQVATHSGWNVPSGPQDVPAGDTIATVLNWWRTVPLEVGTEPAWLTDYATLGESGP